MDNIHFFLINRRCTISKKKSNEPLINESIREKEVRLLGENGEQIGLVSSMEALKKADEKNLDLVMISPNAKPPVCKIMDYGKYKYEQTKKEKEARKNQKTTEIKGIRLSLNIEKHDIETKANNAKKFLIAGDKVRVELRFRGRELGHTKLGYPVMEKFFELLDDTAVYDKPPKVEGRNMTMTLAPKK